MRTLSISTIVLGFLMLSSAGASEFKTATVAAIDARATDGDVQGAMQMLSAEVERRDPLTLMDAAKLWRIGLREAPPLRRKRLDRAYDAYRTASQLHGSHQAKAAFEAHLLAPDPEAAQVFLDRSVALGYPPAVREQAKRLLPKDEAGARTRAQVLLKFAVDQRDSEAALILSKAITLGHIPGEPGDYERRGRALLQASVESGELSAMADLAEMLTEDGDAAAGNAVLERAALSGHVGANLTLGDAAVQAGDFLASARWFERAAQEGSPSGAMALVELHENSGSDVISDAAAGTWLELAIAVDHIPALMFQARRLQLSGETEAANALVERARDNFHSGAGDALKLAAAYDPEDGLIPDPELARRWYERAVKDGDAAAKHGLGAFLLIHGRPDEAPRALALLEEAGDAGRGSALLAIGDYYARTLTGDRDVARALNYYRKAVQTGSLSAMDRMASVLYTDDAPLETLDEAIGLWETAAARGHVSSMTKLGRALIARAGGADQANDAVLNRSVQLLQTAADQGNASAMAELADVLSSDALGEPRLDLARELLRRSADAGRTSSLVSLARLYLSSDEADEAVEIFEEAAERGSVYSMVELARAYTLGIGVQPNIERANDWLRRADAKGVADPRTLEIIGRGYLSSASDDESIARGLELLKRGAEVGNVRSMMTLARAYDRGETLPADPSEALHWYRRAAENGSVTAMVEVGKAYSDGKGVPQDRGQAFQWLNKAVSSGSQNTAALIAIGRAFTDGVGVERDTRTGFSYFERAAQLGSLRAMELMARAWQTGLGTPQDPTQAVPWYQRAAASGSTTALVELGRIYASGFGAAVDQERAFQFFRDAANKGSRHAMREVGRFLLSGNGLQPRPDEGIAWFERAANLGEVGAMLELALAYRNGFVVPEDPVASAFWLERASESGSSDAKFLLAMALIDGHGIEANEPRALELLRDAAELGEARAATYLADRAQTN
ncbi:MAG: tetratricopeptide repeat protein [Pseudomonadota bacterium]